MPRMREISIKHLKCYDAYYEYKKAIADMKSYMRTIGYTDETKIVIFRN